VITAPIWALVSSILFFDLGGGRGVQASPAEPAPAEPPPAQPPPPPDAPAA